jgi:hypothetical protein
MHGLTRANFPNKLKSVGDQQDGLRKTLIIGSIIVFKKVRRSPMKITVYKTGSKPPKRLFTIKDVPQQPGYEWLNENKLRHYVFKADKRKVDNEIREGNGLHEAGAIIRCGRKVLIDLDGVDAWLESQKTTNIIE